jgi:hypothetical protein
MWLGTASPSPDRPAQCLRGNLVPLSTRPLGEHAQRSICGTAGAADPVSAAGKGGGVVRTRSAPPPPIDSMENDSEQMGPLPESELWSRFGFERHQVHALRREAVYVHEGRDWLRDEVRMCFGLWRVRRPCAAWQRA